jgi:hypothetical protein
MCRSLSLHAEHELNYMRTAIMSCWDDDGDIYELYLAVLKLKSSARTAGEHYAVPAASVVGLINVHEEFSFEIAATCWQALNGCS